MYLNINAFKSARSLVTANYTTVATDSDTPIHRSKGQNMLFVMLSQVYNKMPMLPSEDTLLMAARIL